jgi:DNA-binding response OmpR family regulator
MELSNREFTLLEYLLRNSGQVLSRTQILFGVWEYDADPSSNVVDVYVRYLRRKLGDPSPITTVRGAGYRYDPGTS